MRFDWRASAVAATAALVLSLLSGIIGGVAFGALIVRGIIGAVVFGAGAAGVSYAIDRYLPGLKQSMQGGGASDGESADAQRTTGNQVDIVVEDEVDTGGLAASDFELEEAEESGAPSFGASASGEGVETGEEGVEELEPHEELGEAEPSAAEPTPDVEEAAPSPDERGFTPGLAAEHVHTTGTEEEIGELEEADSEGSSQAGESDASSAQPRGDAALDERGAPEDLEEATPEAASAGSLPDIEGFSGDFSGAPANESEDEETSEGSGEDPEIMARAIRTVLKREE